MTKKEKNILGQFCGAMMKYYIKCAGKTKDFSKELCVKTFFTTEEQRKYLEVIIFEDEEGKGWVRVVIDDEILEVKINQPSYTPRTNYDRILRRSIENDKWKKLPY